MRILKNTLAIISLSTFLSLTALAGNKEDLLDDLNTLKDSLEQLSSTKESDLRAKVLKLSSDYNNLFEDLGYDDETISFLVSLGKLEEDFKGDLVVEYTTLKNDIISKVNKELLDLNSLIDEIDLNYVTVSDNQRDNLEVEINQIESNYEDYTSLFTSKISSLKTKYESNLSNIKNNIKNIVSSNTSSLNTLEEFSDKFDDYSELVKEFKENYEDFKDTYLSYSGDITNLLETKRSEYSTLLETNLIKLIDTNVNLNPSLEAFKADMDRFKDILVENFTYKLNSEVAKEYDVLYSESDINSLLNNYENMTNRYFDAQDNVKASEVMSSTGVISTLSTSISQLGAVNDKVNNLLGDGNNSLDIIKIKLENDIINFYNTNYTQYKDDLASKIKEKLRIISLENKNAISIAESINIRYELLSDKIESNYNLEDIEEKIEDFKEDINKFKVLENASLNLKIKTLNYNVDTYLLKKQIKSPDFLNLQSRTSAYKSQLDVILEKFENKYEEATSEKLAIVLERVNTILKTNLSNKNKFLLLNVKLNIVEFLNNLED